MSSSQYICININLAYLWISFLLFYKLKKIIFKIHFFKITGFIYSNILSFYPAVAHITI